MATTYSDADLMRAWSGYNLKAAREMHRNKPRETAARLRKLQTAAPPATQSQPRQAARPQRTTISDFARLGAALADSDDMADADEANAQEPAIPCDMCDGTGQFGGGECQACDGEGAVTAEQAKDKADEILNVGRAAQRASTGIPTPKAGSLASEILAAGEKARGK